MFVESIFRTNESTKNAHISEYCKKQSHYRRIKKRIYIRIYKFTSCDTNWVLCYFLNVIINIFFIFIIIINFLLCLYKHICVIEKKRVIIYFTSEWTKTKNNNISNKLVEGYWDYICVHHQLQWLIIFQDQNNSW